MLGLLVVVIVVIPNPQNAGMLSDSFLRAWISSRASLSLELGFHQCHPKRSSDPTSCNLTGAHYKYALWGFTMLQVLSCGLYWAPDFLKLASTPEQGYSTTTSATTTTKTTMTAKTTRRPPETPPCAGRIQEHGQNPSPHVHDQHAFTPCAGGIRETANMLTLKYWQGSDSSKPNMKPMYGNLQWIWLSGATGILCKQWAFLPALAGALTNASYSERFHPIVCTTLSKPHRVYHTLEGE